MVRTDSSEISTSIRNAVHHLKQLGESFQINTFTEADLNNIDYVADTLMALEKEILKLYVDYETESIESSRLRHRLKILPTSIKNEIQAAVNMARESNVSVIQTLQKELDTYLEKVREYTDQDKQLSTAINTLQAEKNALQHQYDTTITEVNQRVSDKATLQITLNETRDTVRETNQHTFDLEEDIMALKECLMQERNEARQEKVRLEEEIATTFKRYSEQEKANELLKKDVDAANHKVSETELQLRTMYRERERFDNDNEEVKKKIEEQNELFEMEQQEHDRLLQERLQFTESCGIALLDYQTKKASLEQRAATAQERTNEETEKLKTLKQKHEEVAKKIEEHVEVSKTLENTITETGKGLEEIKLDIATKLEKTAKLNLDNAETTKELESMREAHQMMVDSLKLQMATLEKELQHIRNTRISKQKEREILLKTIEQIKLTSRNNDIQHNRFVTQTTVKVTDLSERKIILDRNAREDQIQMKQLGQRLSSLTDEYHQMKIQFEQQIKLLEETTAQLLIVIDTNRNKINETTPEFEYLKEEHEKMTHIYESTKETMIETKRKKQEILDKISNIQRDIREKNKSRDITMLAVKECQHETKQRMQKAHENMLKLEEDIYEKGCRLETLEDENERFQKTIDYLNYQIELFNRFSQQSNVDIKHLDENNLGLLNILESGWNNDRQLEHRSAEKDLQYIDDLTILLEHTEKRKAKVGSIVYRLIGELQHLKYYLEGMSNPSTPILSNPTSDHPLQTVSSSRRSHRRSISEERTRSAVTSSTTPLELIKTRHRPQSARRIVLSASTPIQLTDEVRQRVSIFVEDNFDIKSISTKKSSKNYTTSTSTGQRSARTDFSSWKSVITSAPSPIDENDRRKTATNPKVAFA
ncbi:unnamed protein product [Rotaria sp. Silwood1]|nr:unnamed protein product [Rotaria sp. Silwood1]CAF3753963.1 unnamed protein product [Rotaria sp. Silwood1]CAF4594500.1 unnamed protein product [Rotaria sp. Silwood1]CAF4751585.1 unnamed protein product [Rotaria sp. Silwood1]